MIEKVVYMCVCVCVYLSLKYYCTKVTLFLKKMFPYLLYKFTTTFVFISFVNSPPTIICCHAGVSQHTYKEQFHPKDILYFLEYPAHFFPKKLRPKTGVRGLFVSYEVGKDSFTPRWAGGQTSICALVWVPFKATLKETRWMATGEHEFMPAGRIKRPDVEQLCEWIRKT
jgi:hypothetical protein